MSTEIEMPKARFVVQKRHATHLHYDLRLEREGALKSLAVWLQYASRNVWRGLDTAQKNNPTRPPLKPRGGVNLSLFLKEGQGGVQGENMAHIFNAKRFKDKRRELRRNQTEAEKLLWRHLRNKNLSGFKFFRQYGAGVYILDFYCPKLRLAIEVDGGQHDEDEIREHDELRSAYLQGLGIVMMRFWNNEVISNIEGVLEKIMEKLTPPGLPLNQGEE